jgi:pyridoxine kinase
MSRSTDKPTVIVVSSHVASGAVGNRAAVFALERLGFPVVAVPTVTLSWHPGEGPATRIVPGDDQFAGLVDDLIGVDWLGSVGGVLSGYLGTPGQAAAIASLVRAVKARNPRAAYLCDPISGDAAGPYVPAEVVAAIGRHLLPLADMATPNRHELGFFFGDSADEAGLTATARRSGIGEMVVTSAFSAPGEVANLLVLPDAVHRARHAAVAEAPHGTGDLLAALYLGHRLEGAPPPQAFGRAVGATFHLAGMAGGGPRLPLPEGQAVLVSPDSALAVETVA